MSTVISKSVRRTFEVLELFKREQRPLTATAIEKALTIPQASALVLVRELAALGYLRHEAASREYFPSERLGALTAWLARSDQPMQRLKPLVEETSRNTGETTSLCSRNGYHLQIDHFTVGERPGSVVLATGRAAPLPQSSAGRAVLASLDNTEVERILAAVAAKEPRIKLDVKEVRAALAVARRRRYICAYDVMILGVGAIAFPLPLDPSNAPFALVVAGPTPRIRKNERAIVRAVRPLLRRWFGDRA